MKPKEYVFIYYSSYWTAVVMKRKGSCYYLLVVVRYYCAKSFMDNYNCALNKYGFILKIKVHSF